ncbi:MAG TPA: hypothetical protein VHN99_01120 [Deinococcales bacterium]|nr:hypothetical protein [Deinococcales bacterium]
MTSAWTPTHAGMNAAADAPGTTLPSADSAPSALQPDEPYDSLAAQAAYAATTKLLGRRAYRCPDQAVREGLFTTRQWCDTVNAEKDRLRLEKRTPHEPPLPPVGATVLVRRKGGPAKPGRVLETMVDEQRVRVTTTGLNFEGFWVPARRVELVEGAAS